MKTQRILQLVSTCATSLLAACAGSGSGHASNGDGNPVSLNITVGAEVGVLETEAPPESMTSFLLRGTLPLPEKTYPSADGLLSYGVIDIDGNYVRGQVEIASKYRTGNHADVVEIIARVHRPESAAAGAPLQYKVVELFYPQSSPPLGDSLSEIFTQTKFKISPQLLNLFSASSPVRLHAQDVFGNHYYLNPLLGGNSMKFLKTGENLIQFRNFGLMKPATAVTGAQATLEQLFCVHSYVTVFDNEDSTGEAMSLDLRVSPAYVGNDPKNPLHLSMAYFRQLELIVPKGIKLLQDVEDNFFGPGKDQGNVTVYPIVRANADGTMHVIDRQGRIQRRLALAPAGKESSARALLDGEGRAFCQPGTDSGGTAYYSWWNPATSRYFPQKHRLPSYDHIGKTNLKTELAGEYQTLFDAMDTGGTTSTVHAGQLGWAIPWGDGYGGSTGGTEVYTTDGMELAYCASRKGYRFYELLARALSDRQTTAMYRFDGDQVGLFDMLASKNGMQYIPCDWFHNPNGGTGNAMFGFNAPDNFQVQAVKAQGLAPSYQAKLFAYQPIDMQHLIRFLRGAAVIAYLGNDAMSKDDILGEAEACRLSYMQYPNNIGGGAQGSGMLNAIKLTDQYPGTGLQFGRGEAWVTWTMAAAYEMADTAWRTKAKPWFDSLIDLLQKAQAPCNGQLLAMDLPDGKSYIYVDGVEIHGRLRQTFEECLGHNALEAVRRGVYAGSGEAREKTVAEIMKASIYGMLADRAWDSVQHGPWYQLAMGPMDQSLPIFCSVEDTLHSPGILDGYTTWVSFAYGYELTGDSYILEKLLEFSGAKYGVYGNLTTLKNNLYDKDARQNESPVLALMQSLGYL